jgi:putative ABC transport system permease protein
MRERPTASRSPGSDPERELDEEIETHVRLRTDELESQGLSHEKARATALREMGDRSALYRAARRHARGQRLREFIASVRSDLVLARRRAAASPGPTALALLTFALGIGLTTAGFTVVENVLLRPLPFARSGELVALLNVTESGSEFSRVSAASWHEWREDNRTLASSALHTPGEFTVSHDGAAFRISGEYVSGEFFDVLEIQPQPGRRFTHEELEAGARLALVGERFWRESLAASRDLPIELVINGDAHEVIGVVQEAASYPAGASIWVGEHHRRSADPRAHTWINYFAIGRLAPGASVANAREDLSGIARRIRSGNPLAIYSHGVGVVPLQQQLVGSARTHLLLLAGAVGFVLLIACANLAGLGFARAAVRTGELGVRTALGASRGRLIRQLLTESLALAVVGGALGLLLAWWSTRALAARAAVIIPRASEISLDARVLLFAIVITVLAGVTAGIAPALRASRLSLRSVIGGARGDVRGGRGMPGATLIAIEVAIALTLLTGGALLVRSFQTLLSRELGFRADGVVTARIALTPPAYRVGGDTRTRYWEALEDRIRGVPGVDRVALATAAPDRFGNRGFIAIDGRTDAEPGGAGYLVVSNDYFAVLDVPVLSGRVFEDTDGPFSQRVTVVNRAMAERFWPGEDAIGRTVRAISMESSEGAQWLTIVGVVDDIRQLGHLGETQPEMYVVYRQIPSRTYAMTVLARVAESAPVEPVVAGIRTAINEQDREIAPEISTLEAGLEGLLRGNRLIMMLLGGFALLALTLAAIGLYGILSFAVAQRRREMGVRAALGAQRTGVLALVLMGALRIVFVGAAIGLLLSVWLTRALDALLTDIPPHDPVAWLVAACVLLATTVAAALVPAWRAARADPLSVLRS